MLLLLCPDPPTCRCACRRCVLLPSTWHPHPRTVLYSTATHARRTCTHGASPISAAHVVDPFLATCPHRHAHSIACMEQCNIIEPHEASNTFTHAPPTPHYAPHNTTNTTTPPTTNNTSHNIRASAYHTTTSAQQRAHKHMRQPFHISCCTNIIMWRSWTAHVDKLLAQSQSHHTVSCHIIPSASAQHNIMR